MSREFGHDNYHNVGFMHDKLAQAADTCFNESQNEITNEFGKLLTDLYQVAWYISSDEAADRRIKDDAKLMLQSLERAQDHFTIIKLKLERMIENEN